MIVNLIYSVQNDTFGHFVAINFWMIFSWAHLAIQGSTEIANPLLNLLRLHWVIQGSAEITESMK